LDSGSRVGVIANGLREKGPLFPTAADRSQHPRASNNGTCLQNRHVATTRVVRLDHTHPSLCDAGAPPLTTAQFAGNANSVEPLEQPDVLPLTAAKARHSAAKSRRQQK